MWQIMGTLKGKLCILHYFHVVFFFLSFVCCSTNELAGLLAIERLSHIWDFFSKKKWLSIIMFKSGWSGIEKLISFLLRKAVWMKNIDFLNLNFIYFFANQGFKRVCLDALGHDRVWGFRIRLILAFTHIYQRF